MPDKRISVMKTILFMIFVSGFAFQTSVAQWTSDTSGIGYTSQRSLIVSGNNIFAGTTNNGVFISTNNGTSWSQTSLNNQFIFALASSGSNVYAGTNGNGIFVSTNSGATWSQSLINQYVVSLAVLGNYIFAGVYYNGVYVSTNNGTTWTQTTLNTGDVYSLAVSGSNIIAGKYLNGIYISSNNGSTWTQTSLNNQTIQTLFVNGNDIYAGTYYSAGIYKSTDNGATWNPGTLLNRSVYSFAAIGGTIVAGSDGYGVYVSSDNGGTWVQKNEGFAGSPRVYGLCVLNNYIIAGTDYSSYRRETNQLSGIEQISAEVPANFNLSQNYPNPFNPVTNIQFNLPKAGNVKLVVYDALGREAVTLVNAKYNAGIYNVDFDAATLSSGVYFYRLQTDDYQNVKKMMIVK